MWIMLYAMHYDIGHRSWPDKPDGEDDVVKQCLIMIFLVLGSSTSSRELQSQTTSVSQTLTLFLQLASFTWERTLPNAFPGSLSTSFKGLANMTVKLLKRSGLP